MSPSPSPSKSAVSSAVAGAVTGVVGPRTSVPGTGMNEVRRLPPLVSTTMLCACPPGVAVRTMSDTSVTPALP